jgi:hypothetical protein
VVSVLAIVPRFRGSNPAEGDGFLRVIKTRIKPSFGGEVKPEATYRSILRHVEKPFDV